jgi:ribonucleoside-diphosphate reductase alpha chain
MTSDDRPPQIGQWTESALRVLRERYLLRGDGAVAETPEEMCWRVARAIAAAEARFGRSEAAVREIATAFYRLMVEGAFLPNSPTLMNAGKENQLQYSACYVLPVGDSMEEIFDAVRAAAIIHQSGGGTGFAFSRLRPKNDVVRSTGGRASGPVSFLRVFNSATEAVKQGGVRRGANMGVLRVDHPDILEFIECKLDGGIGNFNISVAITDAFMDALARGADYELVNPRTGEGVGRLPARDVFDRIVGAAWRTGDPGLIFIDRVNRSRANPTPDLGPIEATNPCGEQPLAPWDACNLGSINVARLARPGAGGRWGIDWDELDGVVRMAVRFLDDVIEVNPYPLPQIASTVRANRRIGLGVMGWADLLFALGIPYDREQALELADVLMARIEATSHDQSARLAEERGPFPNWPRSIYRHGRPLRNAAVTTVAPTGTISMIAGCSSGIEPVFALAFEHRVKGPNGERVLPFVSHAFERLARTRSFGSEALLAEVARRGSLRDVAGAPDEVRAVFKTAHEIDAHWHVRHQAVFQKHTDNGVSKTINLRADATEDDVAHAYLLAWELQCLGITVFRDGSKGEQVLHVGVGTEAPGKPDAPVGSERAVKPRPHSLAGQTHRMETPVGTAFITVNDAADGEPFEVFVQVGKAGSDTMAVAEALGRLVSLILRLPSPLSPRRRVEEVASQLARIGGGQPTGFGPAKVLSLPDALARTLLEHVARTSLGGTSAPLESGGRDRRIGDLCRECGQATLVYEEGCRKCLSCGFNEC